MKLFRSMAAIAALAVMAVSGAAHAQTAGFISLGTIKGSKVYVASGSNASRVGNGVLTYVHTLRENATKSEQIWASCDGSVITDYIRTAYLRAGLTLQEMDDEAKGPGLEFPLNTVTLTDYRQSSLDYAAALRPHVKTLCKSPGAEPRNVAINVANIEPKGGTPGAIISMLTGTAVKKGNSVEAWMRSTYYTLEVIKIGDKPLEINGVPEKGRFSTGAYDLTRTIFNCSARQIASVQFIDYDTEGKVTQQATIPADRVTPANVVPDSVGESQLDAVCRVYGGKM